MVLFHKRRNSKRVKNQWGRESQEIRDTISTSTRARGAFLPTPDSFYRVFSSRGFAHSRFFSPARVLFFCLLAATDGKAMSVFRGIKKTFGPSRLDEKQGARLSSSFIEERARFFRYTRGTNFCLSRRGLMGEQCRI